MKNLFLVLGLFCVFIFSQSCNKNQDNVKIVAMTGERYDCDNGYVSIQLDNQGVNDSVAIQYYTGNSWAIFSVAQGDFSQDGAAVLPLSNTINWFFMPPAGCDCNGTTILFRYVNVTNGHVYAEQKITFNKCPLN